MYVRSIITNHSILYSQQNQESIREAIEAQPIQEQRDYYLGHDGDGNKYIHFPQFCGADLRVYRCSPVKMPKIEKPKIETEAKKNRVSDNYLCWCYGRSQFDTKINVKILCFGIGIAKC